MAGVSVVTLAEPDDNCGLTTKLLKVRVVKLGNTVQTKSSNGSDFEILNFSVADSTMALLANCSDAFKMAAIKEGRTLHIRNYSIKNRRLTIGTKARVLQGLAMVVSEELQKRARELICPPSPQKRISEVGNAMKGEILTVVGQVVKVSTFYTKQGKMEYGSQTTVQCSVRGQFLRAHYQASLGNIRVPYLSITCIINL